jgi:hypothetical protein
MKSVALNPIRIAVLSTAASLAPLTLVVDQLARARGIRVPVRKPSAGPGQ